MSGLPLCLNDYKLRTYQKHSAQQVFGGVVDVFNFSLSKVEGKKLV
jgi:hypothetical protein